MANQFRWMQTWPAFIIIETDGLGLQYGLYKYDNYEKVKYHALPLAAFLGAYFFICALNALSGILKKSKSSF